MMIVENESKDYKICSREVIEVIDYRRMEKIFFKPINYL